MSDGRAAAADERFLRRCLRLAREARGSTSPNPMVGAVVVRDGEVVGEGFHRAPGSPHAEQVAIDRAGKQCRGATLYSNVEPCCHQGRTPPCVDAIVGAGIARVVASIADPDPRVDGRGLAALADQGVEVDLGCLARQATALNEAYLRFKRSGRPFVVAKAALSLDAKLATRENRSQWITGEAARKHGHRLRASSDAVLVGVGTVIADDPRLTPRDVPGGGPRWRVVLDSRLRTSAQARLLRQDRGKVLVLAGPEAPQEPEDRLVAAGAEVVRCSGDERGRPCWDAILDELARRDVMQLMIEGGSGVLTSGLEADIIDKLFLFYAPTLLGGDRALPLWGGEGVADPQDGHRLVGVRRYRLGDDWAVEGYLHPLESPAG